MLCDNAEYSSPITEILDKESANIEEDLELQVLNSSKSFHRDELCGWCVTSSDLNRFRCNGARKLAKTASKDQRTNLFPIRKSNSRQSFRSDAEFEFHHFSNGTAYIEQYRGGKLNRYQRELNEYLLRNTPRKSPESCEDCTRNREVVTCKEIYRPPAIYRETKQTVPASPLIVITSSRAAQNASTSGMSQNNKRLYSRPMACIRTTPQPKRDATNWNTIHSDQTVDLPTATSYRSSLSGPVITSPHTAKASWAVIGTEKRPLPPYKKSIDSHLTHTSPGKSPKPPARPSNSYTRRQSFIPLSNSWVRNKDQDTDLNTWNSTSNRRSFSAPNISSVDPDKSDLRTGTSEIRTRTSPTSQGGAQNCSSAVDYSCYTEMFKNVLEYYGTNRLRPNAKPQGSNKSSTLLSVRT